MIDDFLRELQLEDPESPVLTQQKQYYQDLKHRLNTISEKFQAIFMHPDTAFASQQTFLEILKESQNPIIHELMRSYSSPLEFFDLFTEGLNQHEDVTLQYYQTAQHRNRLSALKQTIIKSYQAAAQRYYESIKTDLSSKNIDKFNKRFGFFATLQGNHSLTLSSLDPNAYSLETLAMECNIPLTIANSEKGFSSKTIDCIQHELTDEIQRDLRLIKYFTSIDDRFVWTEDAYTLEIQAGDIIPDTAAKKYEDSLALRQHQISTTLDDLDDANDALQLQLESFQESAEINYRNVCDTANYLRTRAQRTLSDFSAAKQSFEEALTNVVKHNHSPDQLAEAVEHLNHVMRQLHDIERQQAEASIQYQQLKHKYGYSDALDRNYATLWTWEIPSHSESRHQHIATAIQAIKHVHSEKLDIYHRYQELSSLSRELQSLIDERQGFYSSQLDAFNRAVENACLLGQISDLAIIAEQIEMDFNQLEQHRRDLSDKIKQFNGRLNRFLALPDLHHYRFPGEDRSPSAATESTSPIGLKRFKPNQLNVFTAHHENFCRTQRRYQSLSALYRKTTHFNARVQDVSTQLETALTLFQAGEHTKDLKELSQLFSRINAECQPILESAQELETEYEDSTQTIGLRQEIATLAPDPMHTPDSLWEQAQHHCHTLLSKKTLLQAHLNHMKDDLETLLALKNTLLRSKHIVQKIPFWKTRAFHARNAQKVPEGIRQMMEIFVKMDIEKCPLAVLLKLQAIARNRIQISTHQRLKYSFFNVRSQTTMNFYQSILNIKLDKNVERNFEKQIKDNGIFDQMQEFEDMQKPEYILNLLKKSGFISFLP